MSAPLVALPVDLRDYFAAHLGAALLVTTQGDPSGVLRAIRNSGARDAQEWIAKQAYSMADEMLKARAA